jgi:hypothetical protein
MKRVQEEDKDKNRDENVKKKKVLAFASKKNFFCCAFA